MRRGFWIGAVIVWTTLVVGGVREIYGHATGAGERGDAPTTWPANSTLRRSDTGPTLVLFLHPECPCSRASLGELAALETGGATVIVAVSGNGEMWDRAGKLPVQRRLDPGALEATRFGAATSGHVVLYDATGTLRFAGGITGSRGHAGDNIGRRTVQRILDGSRDSNPAHPVFGCHL